MIKVEAALKAAGQTTGRFTDKITQPLLCWFDENKRVLPFRTLSTPYRVWVSEVMLQQTRVSAVLPYFERFMDALPTVKALAECPPEQLNKLWEGLGYYSRARNLQKAAQVIVKEYGGELPADYSALLRPSAFSCRKLPWTAMCCACLRGCATTEAMCCSRRSKKRCPPACARHSRRSAPAITTRRSWSLARLCVCQTAHRCASSVR
ncbi:MAG: hypothetical protein RR215_03775 [Ruthenibacterium sp.]